MEQPAPAPLNEPTGDAINWEAFYRNYRKPGYVAGFEIVNKLGGGVFGMVFKARKESIGKDYAIKFLKVDDEAVRDAVIRELDSVRFFAQVDHPNLVSIEDKGEIDGIPFIVMSYAGEETLRRRLDGGALPRDEALKIFIQAARGVQALHEHSLVHFDLKPANIFLKGDIARVGDYGLSKLVTESRNSLSFGRGTPYYMAPEMLKRRGDVRSDIYSLGVILFESLTGQVPFRGDSEWEVLRKHEAEPLTVPPTIQGAEREVITRCLAKDPEARFQSVREILHLLQAPASLGESLVFPPPARPPISSMPPPAPSTPASPPPIPARSASDDRTAAAAPGSVGEPSGRRPQDTETGPAGGAPTRGRVDQRPRGPVGHVVHAVFRVFEWAILAVLVPIRAISVALGRLVVFLLRLPFRALALLFALAGYLIVALLVLMVIGGSLSLLVP